MGTLYIMGADGKRRAIDDAEHKEIIRKCAQARAEKIKVFMKGGRASSVMMDIQPS